MKIKKLLLKRILLIIVLLVAFQLTRYYKSRLVSTSRKHSIVDKMKPEFIYSDDPESYLMEAILFYNLDYPNIVYAQAVLETGNFNSRISKEYNNLFGLYDSKNNDYYKFNHWSESVIAYRDYIQRRYRSPTNYYKFLRDIKYAKDPKYTKKVKAIVRKNKKINEN